jgi:cytochrome c553
MHEILQQASVNDAQSLRDMSFYLAIQRQETHGEHGDGRNLARGRSLYTSLCSRCHGEFGQGSEQGPIPAVGGQNYTYLREQVNSFIGGHRSMVDPAAMNTVYRLSQDDVRAIADFISRMPASVDVHYGVIGAAAPRAATEAAAQRKGLR